MRVPWVIPTGKGCARAGTGGAGAGTLLAPTGSAPQDSPLPGAEVDDQKPVIFIGVNVMEKVEG